MNAEQVEIKHAIEAAYLRGHADTVEGCFNLCVSEVADDIIGEFNILATQDTGGGDGLLRQVLQYNLGAGDFDFSKLPSYDRDNVAFDAWVKLIEDIEAYLATRTQDTGGGEMMPVSDEKLGDVVHDEKIRKIGNRLDYGWAVAKAVRDLCAEREREAWFDGANSGNSYGWEAKSGESFPDYCERVFADFLATKKGDKG